MMYVLIIVAALILIYLFICYFIASTIIHLNRQLVPRNPKNYGMCFENIDFKASDGVNTKGWLKTGQRLGLYMPHLSAASTKIESLSAR